MNFLDGVKILYELNRSMTLHPHTSNATSNASFTFYSEFLFSQITAKALETTIAVQLVYFNRVQRRPFCSFSSDDDKRHKKSLAFGWNIALETVKRDTCEAYKRTLLCFYSHSRRSSQTTVLTVWLDLEEEKGKGKKVKRISSVKMKRELSGKK